MSIRYQIVSGSFRSPKYSQFPCDTQDWGVWTEKGAFQDFSSSIMHTTGFSYTLLYMRTDNYLFYSAFVDLLQTSVSHTEQIHLEYTGYSDVILTHSTKLLDIYNLSILRFYLAFWFLPGDSLEISIWLLWIYFHLYK